MLLNGKQTFFKNSILDLQNYLMSLLNCNSLTSIEHKQEKYHNP